MKWTLWLPPHSGLWCDTSWKLVCLYPMPHYAIGCRISTLIMVPINFWRNSDLFKKKNVFLAQKLTKLEHFKENLSNFSKKISQIQNINLWNVFGATMINFGIKLNNFGSIWLWNDLFGSKCHIPMFQSPVCPPPYLGKSPKFSCFLIMTPPLRLIRWDFVPNFSFLAV